MRDLILHVTSAEPNGGAVLEALLRDKLAAAPMTPEVDRNDLIAVAVWYIWWERRKATHGEVVQSPARTAQSISTLTLNFSRAKKRKTGIDRHGWVKPKENFVKLNVDAGFNADAGTGSTGAILRDDNGGFLAASCCGIPFISDPSSAEARALRDGLILAGQVGCNRIEVNSDCMDVINVMNQGGNSFGPAAAIYEECSMLCHNFVEVVFSHCPREANMAAHVLARSSEGPEHMLVNDVTVM
jgi:ribonuclease HI